LAVRIRLRRTGGKGQPSYRIVVADSRSPRDGRFIEVIGHYNPRTDPATYDIDEERVRHWLSVGAQPSDPVARLLEKRGIIERELRHSAVAEAEADAEPAAQEG
jgi:small subunit ribosomal protein S16